MYGGIVTNALKGEVQLRIGLATFHLNTLFLTAKSIKVVFFDKTDESECDRSCVSALLVCCNDGL